MIEDSTPFWGTYAGTVEDDKDPLGALRLRVRIPILHGPLSNGETITITDLPWALPTGLAAGATAESGAMVWLPKIGDHVYIRFLDGQPENPIWEWGNQDTTQIKAYPTHNELGTAYPPPGTEFTRFGHFFTLEQTRVRLVTKGGNTVTLDDANHIITVRTSGTNILTLDDPNKLITLQTPSKNYLTLDDGANVATVQAPKILLGANATDPVARLSDLQKLSDTFNSHTHSGVKAGGDDTAVPNQDMKPTGSNVSASR